ncbi:hypothetical protein [Actinomycetospora aeridis]|uniref:Lipoprotein n=1 Tax=Actinomycetospora aeridis TaxID=3129231 RepID=A0ABU8N6S1_9PSEU
MAAVLVVLAACSSGARGGPVTSGDDAGAVSPASVAPVQTRPFADDSPLNSPISDDPTIDPQSNAMISGMFDGDGVPIANIDEFGFGIYDAQASTPKYTVTCRYNWGACPFDGHEVPLTEAMEAPRGSDAQLAVIDWETRTVYEMWQYRWNDGEPSAAWGSVLSVDGSGLTQPPDGIGHSRGSGFSVLAGVVRRYEIQQGRIDHALEFSTNRCKMNEFREPAFQTDGKVDEPNAVPEGARLQLDPSVDVDSLPDLTDAERIVARALQEYGAYAVDCGGSPMAIGFERTPSGAPSPYPNVGITHDYMPLGGIPTDKLRVLASWDS